MEEEKPSHVTLPNTMHQPPPLPPPMTVGMPAMSSRWFVCTHWQCFLGNTSSTSLLLHELGLIRCNKDIFKNFTNIINHSIYMSHLNYYVVMINLRLHPE